MRINTLRKNTEQYVTKNKTKYFILLLAIIAGLISGALFVSAIGSDESAKLTQVLNNAFANINTKSRLSVFMNFLWKNLRSVLLIFLGTLTVYLLPILFINLFSWGFSIGFTSAFITSYFGFNGFLLSLCLSATQLIISIPLTMFLSVTAIDYTLHNTKNKNRVSGANKKKFLTLCFVVLTLLTAFSLIDVFAMTNVINTVSGLI